MKIEIKLAKLLESKSISQRELARQTGVRLASINEMCQNDIIRLTLDNLAKICDALNCDISDILELDRHD